MESPGTGGECTGPPPPPPPPVDQGQDRSERVILEQNELQVEVKIDDKLAATNSYAVPLEPLSVANNNPFQPIELSQIVTTESHDGKGDNFKSKPTTRGRDDNLVARSGRIRHIIALLALSSIVLANMNRQAYNQALVRMIRKPSTNNNSNNKPILPVNNDAINTEATSTMAYGEFDKSSNEFESNNETAIDPENTVTSTNDEDEEEGFDWSGSQISLLQAAFSYGYAFFMIPGGRMSEIYGAKWVIFLSSFGSALCSILTPFFANYSFALLVASRVFMGLCQTGISPALYALLTRWLPPDESSVYLPMIKVGVMIGFMAGSLINGFLPWQSMFYTVGLVGILWSVVWTFFASSVPSEHKFIGEAEQKYIEQCLERRFTGKNVETSNDNTSSNSKGTAKRPTSAPWFRILKNPIVMAFTFTKFTVKLSTDTQTMQIPMYLRNVFQISDQLNGLLNGANFAIQAVFTGVIAYVAKEMVVRGQFGLHKTGIRRLFQAINCFGMALAYLLITFNMGSLNLVCCAVIILSIASMFGAGGEAVLPIDLTTEYAASIMAIANSAANLSGIVLPPIVSLLLANQLTSADKWNHVWWFISFAMACGGFVFTFVVKAKIQGFNDGNKRKIKTDQQQQQLKSNGVGPI